MAVSPSGPAAAAPSCVDKAASEADAASVAKACNRGVEITSVTSETTLAIAEPSGKVRWQQYAAPVRVRRGSTWEPVDRTLRFTGGMVAPVVSAADVRFSAGGSGPLVTFKERSGSVSLSWPSPLPVPVLDRDAATYPEVLPGVDLRVKATPNGFTHVLVVKTAAAAANPALRALQYQWAGNGLTARSATGGTVEVTDGLGSTVLASAPAAMWDSSAGGAPADMQAFSAGTGSPQAGGAALSDADSAGDNAETAAVLATITGSKLTVTPDPQMLDSAPNLTYPLYIDPAFGLTRQRWAYMNNLGYATSDVASYAPAGNYESIGYFRSLFQFDISGIKTKNVYDARFNTVLYHSWSCGDTPMSLWYGQDIDGVAGNTQRTAWRDDQLITHLDERYGHANKAGGCGANQPDMPMEFAGGLTNRIRASVSIPGWNYITLTLSPARADGSGESIIENRKKFYWDQTSLTVWHNWSPDAPAVQAFSSTTDCYKACAPGVSNSITHSDGWWKLNETSGATARDSSAHGRNGTNTAGTVGWADNGAVFDGSDLITMPAPILDSTNSYTISFWAKPNALGWGGGVSANGNNHTGFLVVYSPGGQWEMHHYPVDSASDTQDTWALSPTVAPGQWAHVTAVYDKAASRIKSYANGVKGGDGNAFPTPLTTTKPLTLGLNLNGSVSNVQVYQRALSDTEISSLYSAGRLGGALQPALVRTTQPTLKVNVSDPDGGMLKTDFEVRSSPSDTGTIVTSAQAGDKASGSTVSWQIPAGKLANGTGYFWRARVLDEIGWPSAWTSWQVLKVDTVAPAVPTSPSTQYPASQWGAVVGTQGTFSLSDTAADTAEFEWWVDSLAHTVKAASGVSPRTASITYTPSTDMVHTMNVKAIDAAGNTATAAAYQFWVGPAQAKFSHWKFDETAGAATAADSGSGGSALSTGTLGGAATFGPGYLGNALHLTGPPSYDRVTTSGPVLDTTKSFTVMAWARPSDLAAQTKQTILAQDGTSNSRFELQYQQAANGGAGGWCFVMTAASDGTGAVTACAGASVGIPANGEWVHVAGRYDAVTGNMRVYVMGDDLSCAGEVTEQTAPAKWSATNSFAIGRGWAAGAGVSYFRGDIDDARAYQKVLSDSEICQQAQQ